MIGMAPELVCAVAQCRGRSAHTAVFALTCQKRTR